MWLRLPNGSAWRESSMRLEGVVLLAAPTARSRAYIQALVAADVLPERVLLMGSEAAAASAGPARWWKGIHLPDHGEPVATSCARAGIPVQHCAVTTVNDEAVYAALEAMAPRLVIYSGWGGQIVSERVLATGAPFLHLHSGWLPAYRGSTTLYYALLNDEPPGVTAILLDKAIDTGPVVARRAYPRPPAGIEIDLVFDPAIRADLLVRVLGDYAARGSITALEYQDVAAGEVYYVIHPVLKHLAILSLGQEDAS